MLRTNWLVLLGSTAVVAGLLSGPLACFEDEPDEFAGVVGCFSGKAPRLSVTLSPGACDFIPRCDGLVARHVQDPEYRVDQSHALASLRPLHSSLEPPHGPSSDWWLSSVAGTAHPNLKIKNEGALQVCLRADATAAHGEQLYAWSGVLHTTEADDEERTPDLEGSFVVEFLITVNRSASADAGVETDGGEVPGPDAGPDASTSLCGDSVVEGPEACDDGNTAPDDGCSGECQIEAGWDCTAPPCVPICGDGMIKGTETCDDNNRSPGDGCSADCQVELSILRAEVTPNLESEGILSHFTGINYYIRAELSSAQAQLSATCTNSSGECPGAYFGTSPTGTPPTSVISVPLSLTSDLYRFELTATVDEITSLEHEVMLDLRPGEGELKCEQWTDGAPGSTEERRFGFQLQTLAGAPVLDADYFIYERSTSGDGWVEHSAWFEHRDRPFVELRGGPEEIPSNIGLLVVATDGGGLEAARELLWDQPATGLTQGCVFCSRGSNGSCRIIPTGD